MIIDQLSQSTQTHIYKHTTVYLACACAPMHNYALRLPLYITTIVGLPKGFTVLAEHTHTSSLSVKLCEGIITTKTLKSVSIIIIITRALKC